jgi:hypothetical protein
MAIATQTPYNKIFIKYLYTQGQVFGLTFNIESPYFLNVSFPNRRGYAIDSFDSPIDVFDTIMHSKSPMCISQMQYLVWSPGSRKIDLLHRSS